MIFTQKPIKSNFHFIPDLGKYEGVYNDDVLRKKWNITEDEWQYIDSRIKAVELMGNRKIEDNE